MSVALGRVSFGERLDAIEVVMSETGDIKTATVRACVSCAGGILDADNFCRWCGSVQHAMTASESLLAEELATFSSAPPSYLTTRLEPLAQSHSLHRVSGPLVSAVVASLATGPVLQARPSLASRAIAALLSFPLWLIIVLLSPLDAYAAAKSLSRGL